MNGVKEIKQDFWSANIDLALPAIEKYCSNNQIDLDHEDWLKIVMGMKMDNAFPKEMKQTYQIIENNATGQLSGMLYHFRNEFQKSKN